MELGEKIRVLRERQGLTQEELAAEMGVQRNTVWRWENKKANLKADTIQRLSSTLKTEPVDLMDGDKKPVITTTSNLPDANVPMKVFMSTDPPAEISGRLIGRDGDFYINIPETQEGYSLFREFIASRGSHKATSVASVAVAG